jgi:hypothetical protein
MTTFNVIMEHCKIKRCEINFDFDDEFLCRICCQEKCVGYGFLSTGVHSPCYGNQHLSFRTNIAAYETSVIAKKLVIKKHNEYYDQKCMLLNLL